MYYDLAVYQNFYASFNVHSKSSASVSGSALATYLSNNYVLNIYKAADITALSALVEAYSSDLNISGAGVSLTNSNYTSMVWPSNFKSKLVLPAANVHISLI
jgi:hypothetical protein